MTMTYKVKDEVALDKTQVVAKQTYETPSIEEKTEMTFTKEVWEDFCNGKWCFGCSNCSCR